MAIQGFQAKTTVFNSDGSITETNGAEQTKTTVFNVDGSITETFIGDKIIKNNIVWCRRYDLGGDFVNAVDMVDKIL